MIRMDCMSDQPEAQRVAVLGCINEEAGEIVQVIGKIMRHGEQSTDTHVTGSGKKYDNIVDLQTECGQLIGAIRYAISRGVLDEDKVMNHAFLKLRKLTRIHG